MKNFSYFHWISDSGKTKQILSIWWFSLGICWKNELDASIPSNESEWDKLLNPTERERERVSEWPLPGGERESVHEQEREREREVRKEHISPIASRKKKQIWREAKQKIKELQTHQ